MRSNVIVPQRRCCIPLGAIANVVCNTKQPQTDHLLHASTLSLGGDYVWQT